MTILGEKNFSTISTVHTCLVTLLRVLAKTSIVENQNQDDSNVLQIDRPLKEVAKHALLPVIQDLSYMICHCNKVTLFKCLKWNVNEVPDMSHTLSLEAVLP